MLWQVILLWLLVSVLEIFIKLVEYNIFGYEHNSKQATSLQGADTHIGLAFYPYYASVAIATQQFYVFRHY